MKELDELEKMIKEDAFFAYPNARHGIFLISKIRAKLNTTSASTPLDIKGFDHIYQPDSMGG